LGQAVHPLPVQATALAATPKRPIPVSGRLITEGADRVDVAGHGVVVEVSSNHLAEPQPLLGDRQVHAPPHLSFELVQLCSQPLRIGDALEHETPLPGLLTDMREAQELERLRLSEATRRSPLSGEPAEFNQPRLLGCQLEAEPREPAAKLLQEPARICLMLKADNVIVGEAHDDHLTARMPPPPLVGPQVEHVVEVDVGEQR